MRYRNNGHNGLSYSIPRLICVERGDVLGFSITCVVLKEGVFVFGASKC